MSLPLELLAPAGGPESFFAALEAGADAIYLGLKRNNARQRADNFTPAQLAAAVQTAHQKERRVYLTLNTLIGQKELPEAAEDLLTAAAVGVDGVIVQDLGLARVARRLTPELPLHASTQMSITNSWGVQVLAHLGFDRVILARECTVEELVAIGRRRGPIGLEVFVHGAMCFSVSGQCLFSSFMGGKSANRGRCTQPCRWPYAVGGRQGAPFSMRDMMLAEHLPRLAAAGIGTLKIEGRQRSAQYVYTAVSAYRSIIDATDEKRRQVTAEAVEQLQHDHGRVKSAAYLDNPRGKELVDPGRSAGAGEFIGKVFSVEGRLALVKTDRQLAAGDRVRIADGFAGERASLVVGSVTRSKVGKSLSLSFPVPKDVRPGDLVFCLSREDEKRFPGKFSHLPQPPGMEQLSQRAEEAVKQALAEARPLFPNTSRGVEPIRRIELLDGAPTAQILKRLPAGDLIVPAFDRRTKGIGGKRRKGVILALPTVVFENEAGRMFRGVRDLVKAGFNRWLIGNIGQLALFAGLERVTLIGDFSMQVLNTLSAATLLELGLSTVCVSLETDEDNLGQLMADGRGGAFELVAYSRPPLFVSRAHPPGVEPGKPVDGGKRNGRFQIAADRGLLIIRSETPVSVTGILKTGVARRAKALRVQLAAPDLSGDRLEQIFFGLSRWKPIAKTDAFNLRRDRTLL